MVRLGLFGIADRVMAWVFVWVSIASAIGCIAYGFLDPRFFFGGLLVLAALWYYLAIRWVDRHGTWS